MNENDINDTRKSVDFKNITFSCFARSKVKLKLIQSIHNNDIEPACYWAIELICAGHYNDLWNCIIQYSSKYIHTSNPKLPLYLSKRLEVFKNIINNGYSENELYLRNNDTIRKLFAEIITVLCFSKKSHCYENYAIKNNDDFDITNITNRLKADNIEYANGVFKNKDPKEIFIAINEFMFNISDNTQDNITACYWLEWILKIESIYRQKHKKIECERRPFIPVECKYQMNIIWVIWESLIIHSREKKMNEIIINALLSLFCIKYTPNCNRPRKYLLYWAISILTENINYNNPLMKDTNIIKKISNNIDLIYKQIKKNEKSPKTDYLFDSISEKSNIDKSIQKLETINLLLTNS